MMHLILPIKLVRQYYYTQGPKDYTHCIYRHFLVSQRKYNVSQRQTGRSNSMKKLFALVMVFSLITSFLLANSLELGSPAPQLKVLTDEGITLDLGEALSAGTTLIFFYPKAMTPGCVKQACSLRDGWDELQARNVQIFGVSKDTVKTQAQFRDKYTLPFTLLADTDRKIANAFSKPMIRQAYLFKDGILVWRDLMAATSKQATDVLAALDELEPNS